MGIEDQQEAEAPTLQNIPVSRRSFREKYDVKSLKLLALVIILILGTLAVYCYRYDRISSNIAGYIGKSLRTDQKSKIVQLLVVSRLDSVQIAQADKFLTKNKIKIHQKKLKLAYVKYAIDKIEYFNIFVMDSQGKILTNGSPQEQ